MSVEVSLTEKIAALFQVHSLTTQGADQEFVARFHASLPKIQTLFQELYGAHEGAEDQLIELLKSLILGYQEREESLRDRDRTKVLAKCSSSSVLCGLTKAPMLLAPWSLLI